MRVSCSLRVAFIFRTVKEANVLHSAALSPPKHYQGVAVEALLGFASGRVGSLNNMSVEPDAFVVMQTSLCLITHLMVHVLLACSAFF